MRSTAPSTDRTWPAVAALIVCAALWSLNGPLIKLLDQSQIDGSVIACGRSIIGGLVFLPFALRYMPTLRRVSWPWPVASAACFTIMTASFVIANTMTEAANAIILQYTSPIWVFLLAPILLGERPSRTEGLILLIAMVGVAVIFFGQASTSLPGLAVALLSGFGYGTLTITLRGLRPVNPLVVVAINSTGSGLVLLVPALMHWPETMSQRDIVLLLVLGLVQFTLPYVLFSWALQRIEAHQAALILLLETVLNPIWTFLAIGETPPAATFAGGPLILIGVTGWVLVSRRRKRIVTDPHP